MGSRSHATAITARNGAPAVSLVERSQFAPHWLVARRRAAHLEEGSGLAVERKHAIRGHRGIFLGGRASEARMFALVWLFVPAGAVAAVIGTFFALHARNRPGWNAHDAVIADRAGAYRSSQKTVGIVERMRDIPGAVQGAAIAAMFFGIMWIPSIPLVGVGVAIELEHGPGLATLFGIPGIPLSIAHLVLGIRFTKRSESSRSLARGVAIWSLLHNTVLLAATVFANLSPKANTGGSKFQGLDLMQLDSAGVVVVLYAFASMAYAAFALHAAKVHEAIDHAGKLDPAIEDALLVGPAPVAMTSLATAQKVGAEAPSWP